MHGVGVEEEEEGIADGRDAEGEVLDFVILCVEECVEEERKREREKERKKE